MCYLHETTKMKACDEHSKTHDLINKKGLVDRESLVEFGAQLPTKIGLGWNKKKIKFLEAWSKRGRYFGRARTGSILLGHAIPLQIMLRLLIMLAPNFFGLSLCWGFEKKMTGRLEGPSLEAFLSVCSSKLMRRATLAFRDSNSSWKWMLRWARSVSNVFSHKIRYCRLEGDLLFILMHAWQMYEHEVYLMNSPFEGWQHGRNSCMMEQELWFLPKLYNENFLSDDHCVTHNSWVQDVSRRVRPDANKW